METNSLRQVFDTFRTALQGLINLLRSMTILPGVTLFSLIVTSGAIFIIYKYLRSE